jgi:hypothetical protein
LPEPLIESWIESTSALACDSICRPNGVTAETLIAMMSVTAATTAARRARPSHGRCGVAGCAGP